METTRDSIKRKIATIGMAGPIETGEPVALADVAEPPGSAGTGAGGPVVVGTQFTAVADRTGASGLGRSESGEPKCEFRRGLTLPMPVARPRPVPVARSELKRDSDQLVGLPELVARPEPEPAVRSWLERGSWPSLMYMPHLKTERTTHRAVLGDLNRSQEQSRK